MRQLITGTVVGIMAVLFLPACAVLDQMKPQPMAELKLPDNLSEVGREAQKLINEANVALTAAYNVVSQQTQDKILPPAEGIKYLGELDRLALRVDQAQFALDAGRDLEAKGQAAAISTLITALHKKAAHYRKESQ